MQYKGFTNIYNIKYPVDKLDFESILDYVSREIEKYCDKSKPIIIIGQSMGGFVANQMHTRGWVIDNAIYIGSPLHGANLLNQLERILPEWIVKVLNKKSYDLLKNTDRIKPYENPPPHKYKTISMGWGWSKFDGCVHQHEAKFDEENHTHLYWADHRTIFANPRLWTLVYSLINT